MKSLIATTSALALGAAAVIVGASLSAASTVALAPAHATIGTEFQTPPAVWDASEYDGQAFATDQPDLTDLPTVHAVYLHASDAPSRFTEFAAYFQAENRRANNLLTPATGMAIRWDDRLAADGRVLQDITVVKASARTKSLSGSKQFGLVGKALSNAGLNDPNKKYFVYVDANSTACGSAQAPSDAQRSASNAANGTSYAVAYRPDAAKPAYDANGGFCNPVLHELTHSFGAVLSVAPNYIRGSHCDDDGNDIMCNASSKGSTYPFSRDRPRTYDGSATPGALGNDDYLDPAADLATVGTVDATGKLGHWTVNLSRFLCPRSAADPAVPDCSAANNPVY